MRRTSAWLGWTLCLCASLAVCAQDYTEDDEMILELIREDGTEPETGAEPAAEFLRCNKAAWRMPGQYLVMLRQGTHDSQVQRTIRRLQAKAARRGYLVEILQTYSGALHGFLVKMSSDVLHLAVKLPHVHYIEEDSSIFAQSAPWNLQRLLQPHGFISENGTYKPPSKSEVAKIRASFSRQCILFPASISLGLEYIRATLQAHPVEAVVVLLPFVGGFSRSLNAACRDMVANGAVVIAAAGNYRDDACLFSPASEPEVITVGAVNSADQLMSQGAGGTNFGRCVDLFAPGDDIVSASSDCSTCFTSRSGTSQAAAHAAGIQTPNTKKKTRQNKATNSINFLSLSETHRLTTPNLVAWLMILILPHTHTQHPYGELLCRSVWSERSGVASTDKAISRCRQGEEMMGCSSYAPDGVRVGETISVSNGRMECVAYNGQAGKGVFAVARCCVIGGLRCQVHPSPEPGKDAQCVDPQHHLTGCTSRSTAELLTDSRPHHGHRNHCAVKDGVTSHAVCCHAPSLECNLLENVSTDKDQVEVSCPSGWTLTDCSAISQSSAVLGPVAKGNSCHVRSATGATRAAGIAVCCRVRPSEQHATTPH
uniref:Proprotein convertase subtilisin/kexin type 9 n=1 Tax=Acanthochromis polyacanthus TaxID=80966 RepID=A0A3Q1FCP2_9TELE